MQTILEINQATFETQVLQSREPSTLKTMNTPTPINLSRDPQVERHITVPPPKIILRHSLPLQATRYPVVASINRALIQARHIQAKLKGRGSAPVPLGDGLSGNTLLFALSRAG